MNDPRPRITSARPLESASTRGEALEHPHRIIRGQHRHPRREPDALRGGRDAGEHRLRTGDRVLRPVVLTQCDHVDADLVGQHSLGHCRRIASACETPPPGHHGGGLRNCRYRTRSAMHPSLGATPSMPLSLLCPPMRLRRRERSSVPAVICVQLVDRSAPTCRRRLPAAPGPAWPPPRANTHVLSPRPPAPRAPRLYLVEARQVVGVHDPCTSALASPRRRRTAHRSRSTPGCLRPASAAEPHPVQRRPDHGTRSSRISRMNRSSFSSNNASYSVMSKPNAERLRRRCPAQHHLGAALGDRIDSEI